MKFFRGSSNQAPNPPQVPLEEVSVQNAAPAPEVKKEKGILQFSSGYPRLQLTLRIYCTVAIVAMITTAIYGFSGPMTCLPPYFFLLDAWLIILGTVAILVEWRQKHARRFFNFLTFRTGRGFFYLFLGSLTAGIAGYFGMIVGVMVILGGLFTLSVTFFLYKKKKYSQLVVDEDDVHNDPLYSLQNARMEKVSHQPQTANLSPIQPPPASEVKPKSVMRFNDL